MHLKAKGERNLEQLLLSRITKLFSEMFCVSHHRRSINCFACTLHIHTDFNITTINWRQKMSQHFMHCLIVYLFHQWSRKTIRLYPAACTSNYLYVTIRLSDIYKLNVIIVSHLKKP